MNKLKTLSVAVLLGVGMVGSAMAADALSGLKAQAQNGLTISGDVHGASAYQYRGKQFSDGEPSIGASLTATHSSGLYGSIKTDTVKLSQGSDRHQLMSALTVGYDYLLPYDVKVGGGLTRNFFSGRDQVSDLSFSEAFVGADWNGLHAKVSTVVESSKVLTPGFETGDTYAEAGYTYHYGKYSLGGDVGYSWYNNKHVGAKNGLSLAQVRVGYAFNDQVDVSLTHQFAGDDAYGNKSNGTHKTFVKVGYKF
ncbi:TorF family putative porin [Burkholderia ubonensis]|uniref:TorF family putative porin n=1 Tax=Burkholderia ubonensis TaxID=101571 RepID=UPI000AE0994E|nr:TorF family putative porin [Burkholderia ubonensis]